MIWYLGARADNQQRAKMDISFFLLNVYEAATVSFMHVSKCTAS
jgi:hypothetical protein